MNKQTLFGGLTNANKVCLLMALLVSVSLPLPIRINSIFIFLAFVGFILVTLIEKRFIRYDLKSRAELLMILLFLIPVAGLTHTSNLDQGLRDLERTAFLISFIFIFGQMRNLNISVFNLIVAFAVGCFAIIIYGIGLVLFVLNDSQQDQVLQLGHTYFADYILIHPVYLSIYLSFIFFFLLETIRTQRKNLHNSSKVGMASALIFIVVLLFYLRAQMVLIIFIMLLVMYAIIVLKRRAWLVTFILFTVALLVFLLDSNRVSTVFDTYGKNVSSALDQRFSLWRGTIEGIKTSPFFGAGTGGEQTLINEGYSKTGYQEGIDKSYNAHNQYLQFLAGNGILELACFLGLLFYSFRQSLKMDNYTFLMFNMTVTLIMFTESFLDVQRGVVFFYFFLCAFIYLPYQSTSQPLERV